MSLKRFEDAVRQPVLTHELPDVFLAVELGACRGDNGRSEMLLGTRRSFCALSVALIEVRIVWPPGGDLGGDLVEMKLQAARGRHRLRVLRAYRAEQIGRLGALIRGWRADVSPFWPSDR